MKAALLTLALMSCLTQTPAPQAPSSKPQRVRLPGEFHRNYDRFTDDTHVIVGPYVVEDASGKAPADVRVWLAASLTHKGESLTESVKEFTILFGSSSADWEFLRYHDLYVLADGQRFAFGKGQRISEVKLGGVEEFLGFTIPREDFQKIAASKSIEMRVGFYEIKLTPSHRAALGDLLESGTVTLPR